MKVYAIELHYDYAQTDLCDIVATEELAIQVVKELNKDEHGTPYTYSEYELCVTLDEVLKQYV